MRELHAAPLRRAAALSPASLGDDWSFRHGPLTERPQPGGRWLLPGRRLLMSGAWETGLAEIWLHPWRVLRAASIRIDGSAPAVTGALRSPSLLERELGTPGCTARERWTAAVAHGACVWDATASPGAVIEASWQADGSAPGESNPPPRIERIEGGLRLSRHEGPVVDFILVRGDAIDVEGTRLTARARGALRIVVVAGAGLDELLRGRDRIERRGLAAIAGERSQHARLLADFGTAIESPSDDEVAAFEWAKVETDALLVELPGGARRLAAAYRQPGSAAWEAEGPVRWATDEMAGAIGTALLAAGLREPVRDALRSSSLPVLAAVSREWTGGPGPAAPATSPAVGRADSEVWQPITREILGRWGAVPADGMRLTLRPTLAADRREMIVRRLRVGDSVLDAELRRRFDRVVARLHRRHGPTLAVAVELDGPAPIAVSADEQPLPGPRATVAVSDRHEVLFQF